MRAAGRRSDRLPKCPKCGATGRRCLRPSGHEAMSWHIEREDVAALECMCGICVAWLERRGKLPVVMPPRRRHDDAPPRRERLAVKPGGDGTFWTPKQEELPL